MKGKRVNSQYGPYSHGHLSQIIFRPSNQRNLKAPALRFRVDGKHFENGAFQKWWRHENHVISLAEFSSNTNPKRPLIVAFSNISSVLWTGPLSLVNFWEYIAYLYLNTCVTAQVEVKLSGMCDAAIHSSTWRDIPTVATLKQAKYQTWETIKKSYSGQLTCAEDRIEKQTANLYNRLQYKIYFC